LEVARREHRILITNDSDFGELIYRRRLIHAGVVFLRLGDERTANKIDVLRRLLQAHSDRLPGSFVVVTESTVRFALGSGEAR
jgi:predicted nuclease of predicted toxin-antitoxin system